MVYDRLLNKQIFFKVSSLSLLPNDVTAVTDYKTSESDDFVQITI